jgi:hypothetical protein
MAEIKVYSQGRKHRLRNDARLERNMEIAEINAKYRKRLKEIEEEASV